MGRSFEDNLKALKLIGDDSRLKILGILENRPCSVEELSVLIGVRAPTISHHLEKCSAAGLVRMIKEGNTHIYSLAEQEVDALAKFIDPRRLFKQARSAIKLGSWDEKVLNDFLEKGRLKDLPASRKKRFVILSWLAAKFPEDEDIPEAKINKRIGRYYDDFALLRREMIGYGLMTRHAGVYRRVDPAQVTPNPHA